MADAISTKLPRSAPAPRYAIDRLGEKIEPRLRAIFHRLPAGVSLFAGGIFILVTVFLPLAVNGCGGYAGTGRDLAAGKPDTFWPSWFGMSAFGRWFYVYLLAWGVLAVVAALAHLLKRDPRRSRIMALIALAGATSYFVMADIMIWPIFFLGDYLPDKLKGVLALVSLGLAAYLFLRTARVPSVRASRFLRLVFRLGGALFALSFAGWVVIAALDAGPASSTHLALRVVGYVQEFWPPAFCLFGPLALWYRHGVWPMADSSVYWPSLRRRLALAYAPAVAGQFYAAYRSFVEPRVWGLAVCLAGIHLITLGYLRLARSAKPALQSSVLSSLLSVVSQQSSVVHNS
jgi:hypothetical protein